MKEETKNEIKKMKIKKSNQKRTLITKRGKIRPDIGRKVERLSGPGEGGRGKSEG